MCRYLMYQKLYLWWWCNCVYSVQLRSQLPQNSCHQKVFVKLSSSNHRNIVFIKTLLYNIVYVCMVFYFFFFFLSLWNAQNFSPIFAEQVKIPVCMFEHAQSSARVGNTISQQQQELIQYCMIHHLHKLQSLSKTHPVFTKIITNPSSHTHTLSLSII